MFKQLKLMAGLAITATLVACSTTSPEMEACVKSTPRASSERWNCIGEANEAEEQRKLIERITKQCEGFGFKRGTKEFADCSLRLRRSDIERDIIIRGK